MTVVDWLGCDLVSGRIVEELPGLQPQGPIASVLGAYTSARFGLPVPLGGHGAAPRNWAGATEPGRTMIVAVLAGQPIWAGIILVRRGGSDATVDLATVSLEGYLDRRYVRDHDFVQVDEALIAASLVDDANIEGIGLYTDAPSTGTVRDRAYHGQDDATVYSRLRELMSVQFGPEWTVVPEWADASQTSISKVVKIRKRIGHESAAPTAVFSTGTVAAVVSSAGASEARYVLSEDYGGGAGANHIVATSSGEGESRPQSAPARDEALLASGWPRWEHRFTPSSSIVDTSTLGQHASATLNLMRLGARTLTVTARADAYPLLGQHWSAGDDVGFDLRGHRHPSGLTGVARAIGWELDPMAGVVSPILALPGEEEG